MKVYLEAEQWMSLGIKRVVTALKAYKPDSVTLVETPEEADLHIVHMVGNGQKPACQTGRPYAMIQYCMRTTETPFAQDWVSLWQNARAVWSYYDLLSIALEDGAETSGVQFYHAPLGVESVFRPSFPVRKCFLIGTSGYIADTEGVRECAAVATRLGRRQFHLGPDLGLGNNVMFATGLEDELVADFWSQCSFVAGLRRIEGFELPVLEALMCGSRPIVFDRPHYRQWFAEHAEYVPEVAPDELVDRLYAIMSKPVRAVTPAERSQVARTFDWKMITAGFWEAVL